MTTNAHLASGLAIALISLTLGFQLGTRIPRSSADQSAESITVLEELETVEERDESAESDGDLSSVKPHGHCKMVLVVRSDLKLTPGQVSAQCGYATLACYKALTKANAKLVQHWERTGQAKIALKAKSESQMLELEAIAKSLNLCARLIRDKEGSNATVLGIGPGPIDLVNDVTGKLRLL